jgi:DNA-directed RNA polymerase specialized sigma24 family protein
MSGSGRDLTSLFARMGQGETEALYGVMEALCPELHRLAARHLRGEARRHTLQSTALVSEAYLRLMHGPHLIHNTRLRPGRRT